MVANDLQDYSLVNDFAIKLVWETCWNKAQLEVIKVGMKDVLSKLKSGTTHGPLH